MRDLSSDPSPDRTFTLRLKSYVAWYGGGLVLLALGLAPVIWPEALATPAFESVAVQYLVRALLVPLPLAALAAVFATYRGGRREQLLFMVVALLAALFCEHVHHQFVDKGSYFGGRTNAAWQKDLQADVLQTNPGALPHSYRFLSHSLIAQLEWITGNFEFAKGLFRIVCNVFFFGVVLRYARLFLGSAASVLVVLLTVMIYPITIAWYAGQPIDPLSHLSFVLCLYCLAVGIEAGVGPTLALGVLAKESVAAVSVCRAFYGGHRLRAALLAAVYFAVSVAVVLAVRVFVNRGAFGYGGISGVGLGHIWRNLQDYIVWFPQYLFTLGLLLPGAWLGWPLMNRSFRFTCATLTLALVGSSAMFSWLGEARNLMPAIVLLLIVNARYLEHRLLAGARIPPHPRPLTQALLTALSALRRQHLGSRLLALAAAGLLLWAWRGHTSPAEQASHRALSPVRLDSNSFDLAIHSNGDAAPSQAQGGIFALKEEMKRFFWGSYLGGDGFTGRLESQTFTLTRPVLYVPVMGYPAGAGLSLTLEIVPDGSQPGRTIVFQETNPGESSGFWRVEVAPWTARHARLILVDNATGPGGWLGVGHPLAATETDPSPTGAQFESKLTNYRYYFLCGGAVAALLFVPGCVVARLIPRSRWAEASLRPLPGLLLLGAIGLVCGGNPNATTFSSALRHVYFGSHVAGALLLAIWRVKPPIQSEARAWWCYAAVAVASGAIAAMPLVMNHETLAGTPFASRLVFSSSEHLVPYRAALHAIDGYDGTREHEQHLERQGPTPRASLAGLGSATVLTLFGTVPSSPPAAQPAIWPAERDGFFLARWFGLLTNALVILGAVALARSLGLNPILAGLPWLAISPLVLINTVYVAPKLLAAYFVLQAIAAVLARRPVGLIAGWSALACYSDPIAFLTLPGVALLLFRQSLDRTATRAGAPSLGALRATGLWAALLVVFLAPWIALDFHPERWLRLLFGGGRGTAFASDMSEWIHVRWTNLWTTFTPGAHLVAETVARSHQEAVSGARRWLLDYQYTLHGQMGWVAFIVGLIGWWKSAARDATLRRLLVWAMLPGSLGCLLAWGYSADGLGRHCLMPITALLLALCCAGYTARADRVFTLALPLAALEALSIIAIEFGSSSSFRPAEIGVEEIWLGVLIVAAISLPVCLGIREHRRSLVPTPLVGDKAVHDDAADPRTLAARNV